MKKPYKIKLRIVPLLFISIISILSCSSEPFSIELNNQLNFSRQSETVEIDINKIPESIQSSIEKIGIYDVEKGTFLTNQLIDMNQDGVMDLLLFQPNLAPMSSKIFHLKLQPEMFDTFDNCFSRIVPERIDDYTWENDKVAFRTYGPAAQLLVEGGKKGGIISSGIDCWLKKVDYPIINKWYKESEEKGISYHEDHGEGLDNYHVGASRGAGGLALKMGEKYYISKNFINHETISNGPLRTVFRLDYEDWDSPNGKITEHKIISLDKGSNFSKIEVNIKGTDNISAGISLQENNGSIKEINNGILLKQNHFETILSNVLLTSSKYYDGFHVYNPKIKDKNHVFLDFKLKEGKLVYYSGFHWSESKQFKDHSSWEAHLNRLAVKIDNPIQIKY